MMTTADAAMLEGEQVKSPLELTTLKGTGWWVVISGETGKPYFIKLCSFLNKESSEKKQVYPPKHLIFNWAILCPQPSNVRVVILGQDPYHNTGQAMGLAFSVPPGVVCPPSLVNIFNEIKADLGHPRPSTGSLEKWATQGVLLLNTILTVRAHEPTSHSNKGWETFTEAIIKHLVLKHEHIVFLLWGSHAQAHEKLIPKRSKHLVLKAPHPSPLSAMRGFFGCRHFSQANEYLRSNGRPAIDWNLSQQ